MTRLLGDIWEAFLYVTGLDCFRDQPARRPW